MRKDTLAVFEDVRTELCDVKFILEPFLRFRRESRVSSGDMKGAYDDSFIGHSLADLLSTLIKVCNIKL